MQNVVTRVVLFVAASLVLVGASAFAQSALDQARSAVAESDYTAAARFYDQAVRENPKESDVLIEAGDVNMELERYSIARQLFERAVDLERKDADANRKLGLALSALGQHDDAIASVKLAIRYDDASMANYLALSQVYVAFGRDSLTRAEQTAMSARSKFPDEAEPYLALGDLYYARGVFELAMTQYEEAIKRDPTYVEPRVRLGRSYREMARRSTDQTEANEFYNKALQEFNKVTSLNPKIARPWYEQGEIYLLAERFQDAGVSFEAYTKLRPEDPRGDLMLARAAYGGHYFKEAVAPLERMLSRNDSLSLVYHDAARSMLAKSYFAIKDYANASKMYGMIPDSALDKEAMEFYAKSLLESADTSKALDVYLKLVAANPEDCKLSLSVGNTLYKMKRYDQVIEVFNRRLVTCPDQPASSPYLFIGLSQITQKKYDDAIVALERSVAADSTQFQPFYWLMNAHASKKEYDKAADVARAMVRRGFASNPENAQGMATANFFIGLDNFNRKKYKDAIDDFERATTLKTDYADAYLYIGFAYHSLTDKDNACKYYRIALKYNPNSPDAKKNLKALGCE